MPGERAEIIGRTPWCPSLRRASAWILIGAGKLNQPTGDRSLGACIAKRGEAPLERSHRVGLDAARVAAGDMVENPISLHAVQLAVDQRRQP